MRVMVLIKADKDTEAGVMPSEQLLADMGRFNEELVKAGVMLAGDGLQPSSKGARVHFAGRERKVVDGPFAETKELIGGYWHIIAGSLDEAAEIAAENPCKAFGLSYEIRPLDPERAVVTTIANETPESWR